MPTARTISNVAETTPNVSASVGRWEIGRSLLVFQILDSERKEGENERDGREIEIGREREKVRDAGK